MSMTKLGIPDGKMLYHFVRSALLTGADEEEVIETMDKWLKGALEVPYSKEEMEQKNTKLISSISPKKDDIACAACIAACCYWWGCDGVCTGICYATVCK